MADQPFLASNSFNGDGSTVVWEFSFEGLATDAPLTAKPYIDSGDVLAELITGEGDAQIITPQAFLFETDNSIRVEPAVPVGTILRIYRQTENRFPLVNYQDLQSVGASDLDLANRQAVYIVQEARDAARGAGNVSAETLALTLGAAQDAEAAAVAAEVSASTLRQDLADDADPAKGAALIGYKGRSAHARMSDWVSVKDFGAVGDGVNDDTASIQAAFDSPDLAPVFFPPGDYKLTGTGSSCLTLTKNKHIYGSGRASTLRADSVGTETSMLRVAFDDNKGFLDVRRWQFRDMTAFFNGGGKHCLHIEGGFPILNSTIFGCSLSKGSHADAHSIYVIDNLAHSSIENSGFDTAYLQCFDANLISKCLTFGSGPAITFNCELGVRNNIVRDCTLVNRDGAVHIVNGDNIRIINNQIELAVGPVPPENQSAVSAMVWLEGVDRPVFNTIIEENNFGGGTSVDHLVYIDNGQRTVVDKNNFVAVNVAEVYMTSAAKYNVVGRLNCTQSQLSNPRNSTLFKAVTVDLGTGNMGAIKSGLDYAAGDWLGGDFWKNSDGVVQFIGTFSAGATTPGTVMAVLPVGARPYIQADTIKRNLLTYTDMVDNAVWIKSNMQAVEVDSVVAPDGEVTADGISTNTASASHYVCGPHVALLDSTTYAASFYIKRADPSAANSIRFEINDDSTAKWVRGLIDLTTGGVSASGNATYFSGVTATSVDAGEGWWRVQVVFTSLVGAASSTYRIYVTPNNVESVFTAYTGDPLTHRITIWGYQMEASGSATSYQRVVDATTIETVFTSRKLLATTDAGVGYVDLTRQGVLSVGSLPSSVKVGIESFQASAVQE